MSSTVPHGDILVRTALKETCRSTYADQSTLSVDKVVPGFAVTMHCDFTFRPQHAMLKLRA
eukprot:1353884-Amphidinium_carterae.1